MVLISSDILGNGAFKQTVIEHETELKAIYRRPAYQYTELEDKINGSSQRYYAENDCIFE